MVNNINDIPGSKPLVTNEPNKSFNEPKDNSDSTQTKSHQDSVELSQTAKQLDDIKALIDKAPDIDMERVEAIKKALDSGELNIDANALAKKLMELESF